MSTYPKTFTGISQGICVIKGQVVSPDAFADEVAESNMKMHRKLGLKITKTPEGYLAAARATVSLILSREKNGRPTFETKPNSTRIYRYPSGEVEVQALSGEFPFRTRVRPTGGTWSGGFCCHSENFEEATKYGEAQLLNFYKQPKRRSPMKTEKNNKLVELAATLKGLEEKVAALTLRLEALKVAPIPPVVIPKADVVNDLLASANAFAARLEPKKATKKKEVAAVVKAAPEPTQKTKRVLSEEQVAKLNAAREAWFKKMGYGKYKKEAA